MENEKNETPKEEKKEVELFPGANELFAEDNKKKAKKVKIVTLVLGILFVVIGALMIASSILFSKKDKKENDKNIDYLVKTYGENVTISFLNKKKQTYLYKICSKKTSFCVPAQYNEKKDKWSYPNKENSVSVLLFIDYAVGILDNNNVEYKTYIDTTISHDIPNNIVLVIKKDNEGALINAISNINGSNLIDKICGDDGNCNANYHITIFNKADYEIITSTLNGKTAIKSYADLYEVLYNHDDTVYGSRLGKNIERHNIGTNMFSCSDDDCNNHKHIAYRYVAGNHNHVDSTIIVEGIN